MENGSAMVSKNKTVLVTGAAGMLGHKVAEACHGDWKVITADIAEFDITSLQEALAFVKSANPDVLVNCAGIAEPLGTSILDIEPVDWHHLIDVHLHGTFNTCRHAAPLMAKAGGGSIINTSSHLNLDSWTMSKISKTISPSSSSCSNITAQ